MAEQQTQQEQQASNTLVPVSRFTGTCFVGLKKVEYISKEGESIIVDGVMDILENRTYNNNLMLGFFSINGFGSEKTDKIDSIIAQDEDVNESMLRQLLKKAGLFDFASFQETTPGIVNILIVADCIIHWDNKGSYIQPMHENLINDNIEEILKSYTSKQQVIIYTNRELSGLSIEHTHKQIDELPVTQSMWVNQPSLQEVYGNAVLIFSLIVLGIGYGISNWQQSIITDLSAKIKTARSIKVNEKYYKDSSVELAEIQKNRKSPEIQTLIIKDLSNTISKSDFSLDSLKLDSSSNSNVLIATIVSKDATHTILSEQESLARNILDNSLSIVAVRKKEGLGDNLILEAMIDIKKFETKIELNK